MSYRCRVINFVIATFFLFCTSGEIWATTSQKNFQNLNQPDHSKILMAKKTKKAKPKQTPSQNDDFDSTVLISDSPEDKITRTLLLDIESLYLSPQQKEMLYLSAFQTLADVEDLGELLGKENIPDKPVYKNPVLTCQCLNAKHPLCMRANPTTCIARVGSSIEATYVIYGFLKDMDDLYLLEIHMVDVQSKKELNMVKTTLPITAEMNQISNAVSETICKLTKRYGCGDPSSIVAAPAITATPEMSQKQAVPADVNDIIEEPKDTDSEEEVYDDEQREPDPVMPRKPPVELTDSQVNVFKTTGWAMIGISAASLIGGATCTGLMYKYKSDYDSAEAGEGDKARDAKDKTLLMQWTSIGLYSAAGLTAAVGIPMLVLGYMAEDYNKAQENAMILPVVGPDNVGLALSGRF